MRLGDQFGGRLGNAPGLLFGDAGPNPRATINSRYSKPSAAAVLLQ